MTGLRRLLASGWLALATLAIPAAHADELEEVLVSASRFRQALDDYAGSASRLSGAEIATRGATHYADLLNMIPGVQLQRGSGQEGLLAIRSPVLTGAGACGAFLVLEDGIPLRPPGFCNANELLELNTEQAGALEVLRGPGSAAYGANAVHGIVQVLSREPDSLGRPGLSARWGDQDLAQLGFEWRGTANDDTSIAAYGFWRHDGGFRAASGSDEGKLNLLARWPTHTGTWTWRAAGTVLNQETAGFIRGFDSYRDPTIARSNANPEAFRDAWSARSTLSFAAAPCQDCSTAAYLGYRRTAMQFLQHFLLGKPLEENAHESLAAGAQWRRPFGQAAHWQLGFDASRMRLQLTETQSGPTLEGSAAARAIRPAGRHYDYRAAGTTLSANGALDVALGERQQLALQARLERTRYDYDNRMAAGNLTETGAACAFGGCLYNRPADRVDQFVDVAARLEWQMRVTEQMSVYLSAARGFRPPEVTELYRLQRGQNIAALDSEIMAAAEAGLRLRGAQWRASLALFAQEKRNVLLRDANGFNIDGGRTRHHGVEYQFSAALGRGWQADLGGSWAVHRYAFNRAIDGGETVVNGTEIDTAPRHLARASLYWTSRAAFDGGLALQYVGRYFVDAGGQRRYPGHAVSHAWLGWRGPNEQSLRLQIENLSDRRYADRADFAQGEYRYFPAAGRRVMLEYSWSRR